MVAMKTASAAPAPRTAARPTAAGAKGAGPRAAPKPSTRPITRASAAATSPRRLASAPRARTAATRASAARARGMETARKAGDGYRRRLPKMELYQGPPTQKAPDFDLVKAFGDFIASIPAGIHGAARDLNGGPGTVSKAMNKK